MFNLSILNENIPYNSNEKYSKSLCEISHVLAEALRGFQNSSGETTTGEGQYQGTV